jgi:hypothetical protein
MDDLATFNIRQIDMRQLTQGGDKTELLVKLLNDQLLSIQRNFNLLKESDSLATTNALLYGGA